MWHLSHISLRSAFAIAVLVLVPAWNSGSILSSTSQAQGPTSVPTLDVSKALNAKGDASASARPSATYGKLPISFEVNQGQTDRSVQFLARGAGYTLFLTPGEAVLSLHVSPTNASKPGGLAVPRAGQLSAAKLASTTPPSTLRLQLVGSNTAAKAEGVDPLPGNSNYFVGNDPRKWHTDVATYAKVRYSNIYPGIDLLYYGNQEGRLEHDFVVAPGADPNAIAMEVHGADQILLQQGGSLALRTKAGNLTLNRPAVYQTIDGSRKMIPASYTTAGNNQLKFRLGSYDKQAALVIDPVLVYTAVFGGSRGEYTGGMQIDSSGNAYVTGWTDSVDFPVLNGIQGFTPNQCAFVSKLNTTGSALVYSTYLGGTLSQGTGIAVGSDGRAYVTGDSGPGLSVKNAYQSTMAGGSYDAFLSVLNAAGDDLVYSTYLGGAGDDQSQGIALDPQNNAYITGSNGSSSGFPKLQSLQPSGPIFVAKFGPSGQLQYSSLVGDQTPAILPSRSSGIAVDSSGYAYITGVTASANFPTTINAMQKTCPTCSTSGGAFAARLGLQGNSLMYSTYLNHASSFAIAVDSSGNAYLGGIAAAGFQLAGKPFSTKGGAFVAKLNPSGSGFIFSTHLGGSGTTPSYVGALAIDQYRQVYVTGSTGSSDFPLKSPIQLYDGKNLPHRFVTTLSSSGSSIVYYSTYFGTGQTESSGSPFRIAVDKALNVYLAGTTEGSVLSTPGALSRDTSESMWNVFVSKVVIMDDLALGLSASSGTVVDGGNLTYTIAVTSKGPDFGSNVRIDDPLPVGTTFVAYNAGGGACSAPTVGSTGTLHCTLPKLEKGGTYTVTLTVKVNAVAGTTLSNTATTVSNTQDFVPGNNIGTLTTKVN
jgi:uncharacterized repeat protein (TIGR01451 family)